MPLPEAARSDEKRVRRGFWAKIRRVAGQAGFVREATAAYYCALDPATPTRVRVLLLAALAYFVMPADAIPDFLAGIGFTDDIAVLLAAWRAVAPQIQDRHRDRADEVLVRRDKAKNRPV